MDVGDEVKLVKGNKTSKCLIHLIMTPLVLT